MNTHIRILIVEDSEDDAELILREIRRGGYEVNSLRVQTAVTMQAALDHQTWDLVISDHSMPQFNGRAALKLLQETGQDIPFIAVSGTMGEDVAVSMMKAGAHDYLVKGKLARLVPAIERELTQARVRRERKQAEEAIRQRLSELEVLYQSGLALNQLANPKAIAQKIIDLLDQKMDWHHTAIRMYHPEDETLELLAFNQPNLSGEAEHRAAEERYKATVTKKGEGLSGWVVEHGETVRTGNLKNDPRYLDTFPNLQSGLYVPIKTGELTIGVISIESEQANAFSESDERLSITLATQAAIAIDNAQLFHSLQRSNIDLTSAYDATIEGWSRAMDLRDKETEGHTLRVTKMTLELARVMHVDESQLTNIRRGALLHDMGKLGVPDSILLKSDKLTEEEWGVMSRHPTYAYEMLSSITYLKPALSIPYCHHEKWDGTGYPRGLKGEEIPLAARIFAVVDVWDALVSDRPYRKAWPEEKIFQHIRAESGKHFDPQIVEIFLKFMSMK